MSDRRCEIKQSIERGSHHAHHRHQGLEGIVSEVYSDDPNTEIVILDEDRTDVEDIPQIELPAHQVY